MASTIVTKNSSTASAVPVSGDLTQGELAVNVTDKKLYTKDSGGTVVKLVGGLGNQEANAVAITGGSINGTTVGATTASTGAFTTLSASSTTTLSGGTANGVAYLNGSKVVTTGSALTFDGTNLGIGTSSPSQLLQVRKDQAAYTWARIDNQTNSASAYAGLAIGANGNTWGITIGSSAANSNALSFVLDATGTNSEKMRLDSSGNLGLGVTPSAWTGSFKALQVGTGGTFYGDYSNTTAYFGNNAYFNGTNWKYISSSYALYAYQDRTSGKHVWANAASGTAGNNITWTEAMTLDSSGNLLVGTTSQYGSGKVSIPYSSSAFGIAMQSTTASSANYAIEFKNSSGSGVGSISASTTATTYSTSSDYRLKEDIAPMTGALSKVAALKPCTYKWKSNGSDGEGFIAHELQVVVPQAVVGEKDAVETYTDEEGNEQTRPVYQGIDTSFLVATLTAAIQEQQAMIASQSELITQLTERITALEAK